MEGCGGSSCTSLKVPSLKEDPESADSDRESVHMKEEAQSDEEANYMKLSEYVEREPVVVKQEPQCEYSAHLHPIEEVCVKQEMDCGKESEDEDFKFEVKLEPVPDETIHENYPTSSPQTTDATEAPTIDEKETVPSKKISTHRVTGDKNMYRFSCDNCGKRYKQKRSIKHHVQFCTSENPSRKNKRIISKKVYYCEICKKAFTKTTNLKIHLRIHTGKKPYVCDICEKPFSQASYLKKHKHLHTGEKPHCCGVCNKRFATVNGLRRHQQTHRFEKYACQLCSKQVSDLCQLKSESKFIILQCRHNTMHL